MSVGGLRRGDGCVLGVGRLRLRYRSWEVADPRAALVLVHGLAEHSGRYDAAAEAFAGHGLSTYACDLRGHGLSDGRRGHAASFDLLLQDLDRFRREVHGMVDHGLPIFLLGHSMGGLIALRYQQEYGSAFRGAIVVAPWLATALPVPRWKVMLANAVGRVLPALPVRARIDPDKLSRDPHVVRTYREDPLVHDTITPRLFAEVSMAMGLVTQRSEKLSSPILFLLPGGDRLVDTERSHAFASYLPASLVTVKLYPHHSHELLNEPDRLVIIRDVIDWIERQVDGTWPGSA